MEECRDIKMVRALGGRYLGGMMAPPFATRTLRSKLLTPPQFLTELRGVVGAAQKSSRKKRGTQDSPLTADYSWTLVRGETCPYVPS